MKITSLAGYAAMLIPAANLIAAETTTNEVTDLGTIVVEGTALSRYRPATVNGATFTDAPPEELPTVVDTLTEDYIREHNPTDLHDLLRYVPGIETGGKSLLVRNPGQFTIRGMGGTEPAFDGVLPIGRGAGLFMDPFLMERIEIVKGPIGSLAGGAGSSQNASGGGGAVNLYMKSARLDKDEVGLQANTSVGKHTLRQRGMVDVNETAMEGKTAVRVIGTADYYEPPYIHQGIQNGARPRESFTMAPSVIGKAGDDVTMGVKSMFQYTDQPGYIGVPVYRGHPGGGYHWYESSCRRGDRATYESFMVNPWLDWQVTDEWLLKFGAGMKQVHDLRLQRSRLREPQLQPLHALDLDEGAPVGDQEFPRHPARLLLPRIVRRLRHAHLALRAVASGCDQLALVHAPWWRPLRPF